MNDEAYVPLLPKEFSQPPGRPCPPPSLRSLPGPSGKDAVPAGPAAYTQPAYRQARASGRGARGRL